MTHDYAALKAELVNLKERADGGEWVNLTDALVGNLPAILAALEAAQQVEKMTMMPEQLRALDAQIAAKVMGWKQYISKNGLYYFCAPGSFSLEYMRAEQIKEIDFCKRDLGNAPRYSTEAPSSRQLRAKLGERWDWILGQGKACQDEPPYGFALYNKGSRNDDYIAAAEAETEELAVVLCTCKAFGIEVEK